MNEIIINLPIDNNYLISNYGYLINKKSKRIIKGTKRKDGYISVHLYGRNLLMHRLVAISFIPNLNNYSQINHKDENKSNNNVNNLEWCDSKYNINYGNRTNKQIQHRIKKVIQKDMQGNIINQFNSVREASRITGYSQGNISNVCRKLNYKGHHYNTYKGYMWEYKK